MKLLKFFMTMICLTAVSLVYIQLQVQILDLAYQGKSKETQIQKLVDHNSNLWRDICTLKSATNLGIKLLNDSSDMKFLDGAHVAMLTTPRSADAAAAISENSLGKRSNFLVSLFSLKSQAEAEPTK